MKEITKTTTVFITDDGTEFFSEKDAKAHEKETKDTRYFSVAFNFDCTEGRCYNSITYFAVKA
jgi:hypothetical protein